MEIHIRPDHRESVQEILEKVILAGGDSGRGSTELVPTKTFLDPSLSNSTKLNEVRSHGHVLTPWRYVGAEEQEDDGKLRKK